MQGVNCVKGEIHNVLTVLRLSYHRDPSSSYYSDDAENPLIRGFKDLHEKLCNYTDLLHVDTRLYLQPFLSMLITESVDIHVVSITLQAIQKFLMYGHIREDSPHVVEALSDIVTSTTKCNIDGGRKQESEVVYMRIIEVLLECLRCPAGHLLTNDAVFAMISEVFKIRSFKRCSMLLSQYADNAMMQMVLVIFARLSRDVKVGGFTESDEKKNPTTHSPPKSFEKSQLKEESPGPEEKKDGPYGLPVLYRVLKFLANLLNPGDPLNNDQTRVLGLRLIRTVFETAGKRLGAFPTLVQVIQADLCKYLLQNTQSKDLYILSLTLRIVFDLFSNLKEHLKVQLEVFFTSIHLRIGESPTSSPSQKELVVESLVEFCSEPSLIVGIYRNYDCEVGCTNLFEDLCKFLASTALPHEGPISLLNTISLEGILTILDSISKRFCRSSVVLTSEVHREKKRAWEEEESPGHMTAEEEADIVKRRQEKKKLHQAALHFNSEKEKSFPFLQGLKILPDPLTPQSIVKFFKDTPGLDKKEIGDYLGGEGALNKSVLAEWTRSFDFKSVVPSDPGVPGIDCALRAFITEGFRLPGEAQKIDRIVEAFSKGYFAASPGVLQSESAALLLTFAMIMLNTDAHNGSLKKKMTKEEFIHNLRPAPRISEKDPPAQEFPREYLSAIYDAIVTNEIRMNIENARELSGETSDKEMFDGHWNHVLSRSRKIGMFETSAPKSHGKEMFNLIWDSAIETFGKYFEQRPISSEPGSPPKILQKIAKGCETVAKLCSFYNLNDIFNNLVISLSTTLCGFLEEASTDSTHSNPKAAFGANKRAAVVCQTLFKLILEYGDRHLLDGWNNVIHCILWLRHLDLLPVAHFEIEDFLDKSGQPLESLKNVRYEAETSSTPSLRLSSFLWNIFQMTGSDDIKTQDPEPRLDESSKISLSPVTAPSTASRTSSTGSNSTEDEDLLVAAATKCVEASNIPGVFSATKGFAAQPLIYLVRALTLVSAYGTKPSINIDIFDKKILNEEAAVFCLERLSDIVEKNQQRLDEKDIQLWPEVWKHFSEAITRAPAQPTFYIERVVVNLLRFSVRLRHAEKTTGYLLKLLQLLDKLSDEAIRAVGERIAAGLILFVQTHAEYIHNPKHWRGIFKLLLRLKYHTRAVSGAFSAIKYLVESCVNFHTFAPLLEVLGAFAQSSENPELWAHVRPDQVLDQILKLHEKLDSLKPEEKAIITSRKKRDTQKTSTHRQKQVEPGSISTATTSSRPSSRPSSRQSSRPSSRQTIRSETPSKLDSVGPPMEGELEPSRLKESGAGTQSVSLEGDPGFGMDKAEDEGSVMGSESSMSEADGLEEEVEERDRILSQPMNEQKEGERREGELEEEGKEKEKEEEGKEKEKEKMEERDEKEDEGKQKEQQAQLEIQRTELWLLSLKTMCMLCIDKSGEVRRISLETLHRAILASRIAMKSPQAWKSCFENLLIPLLHRLSVFEPEIIVETRKKKEKDLAKSKAHPSATGTPQPYDIRLKAANVLFQAFLHNLDTLSKLSDFQVFWLRFIGSMERYMKTEPDTRNARGVLSIQFNEYLKNVLLVMQASGTFDLISKRNGQDLWALTWAVIDSFRPDLRSQLMADIGVTDSSSPSQSFDKSAQSSPSTDPRTTQHSPPPSQTSPTISSRTPSVPSISDTQTASETLSVSAPFIPTSVLTI